jgi:hypothetical protein
MVGKRPAQPRVTATTSGSYVATTTSGDAAWDWSPTNLPWEYTSTAQFTETWPVGTSIVDIQTTSTDFYTNLNNTVTAAPGRVVVRLGAGVYSLKSFRPIGASGDVTYAFGFWFPKLQGFLGQGPDKTFVQMDAGSMSQAQLTALSQKTQAAFAPNQMGLCRIDGATGSPILIAGVTFRAADQQPLTSVGADVPVYVPQSAPHQGVVLFNSNFGGRISYTRFQGAGKAMNSQPPFEHANATSQYGSIQWNNVEFDGRRSPALDPAQPRRCGVWMGNNETLSRMTDCWLHHSNVSRYAANDENRDTQGLYEVIRCKAEQITNVQNKDPAINGGATLGGYTNATPFGWESCNGTIRVVDSIIRQDNPFTDRQIAQHFQLTKVGARDPIAVPVTGFEVIGGEYHNIWAALEGFTCFRITATHWSRDGYANIDVRDTPSGPRKTPYVYTGAWPPTATTLTGAGVRPDTHYIVRTS